MQEILLIESQEEHASIISEMLRAEKYSVVVVRTAAEGFSRARLRPSLILMSVELPDVNGFALCSQIKKDSECQGLPIILMSEDAGEDAFARHRTLSYHAEGYLHKPVDVVLLLQMVREHILASSSDELEIAEEETLLFDRSEIFASEEELLDVSDEMSFDDVGDSFEIGSLDIMDVLPAFDVQDAGVGLEVFDESVVIEDVVKPGVSSSSVDFREGVGVSEAVGVSKFREGGIAPISSIDPKVVAPVKSLSSISFKSVAEYSKPLEEESVEGLRDELLSLRSIEQTQQATIERQLKEIERLKLQVSRLEGELSRGSGDGSSVQLELERTRQRYDASEERVARLEQQLLHVHLEYSVELEKLEGVISLLREVLDGCGRIRER